jgi:hypothetical protein
MNLYGGNGSLMAHLQNLNMIFDQCFDVPVLKNKIQIITQLCIDIFWEVGLGIQVLCSVLQAEIKTSIPAFYSHLVRNRAL